MPECGPISSLQKYREENKQNEEKTPVFWENAKKGRQRMLPTSQKTSKKKNFTIKSGVLFGNLNYSSLRFLATM